MGWLSGQPEGLGLQAADHVAVTRGDPVAGNPDQATRQALGAGVTRLRTVLVRARDLGALDPAAAAGVHGTARPGDAVWYLRGLDPDGTIRWAALAARGDRVLARGTAR